VVSFCHTNAGVSPSSFGINTKKDYPTQIRKIMIILYWCVFRARLGRNLWATFLGFVYCIFRWFRQETCTHVHINSYAHANFNRFCWIHEKQRTVLFFWEASKNNNNKLTFLAVWLIWAYGIIHKGLDPWKTGKTECMYTNIYVLCFCFVELDAIVLFLIFFS
jgi:hypothetical protein